MGRQVCTLRGDTSGDLASFAISPDGRYIVSAVSDDDSDGDVKIWNVATGAEVGSHGGFTLRSDDSVLQFREGSRIVRRRRVLNLGCFADAHASRPHSRGMLVIFHSRREAHRERFA